MQGAHENLRVSLWDKLKVVYNKYANPSTGEIETERVKDIVTDVLGETSPEEIHYVMKNMFRLDVDNNGSVDFLQFGNFLFKRHCGEMSLQKTHKEHGIKNGAERKINTEEFVKLINRAFAFLEIQMDPREARRIMQDCDKDKDGMITYVEYFQFIEKYICFSSFQFSTYNKSPEKKKKPEPKQQPLSLMRQWNGRLRLYLWLQLRKLYEAHVKDRSLDLNDSNLRGLVKSILRDLNESEMTIMLSGLFKLKSKKIEFIPFALAFFNLIAQIGLSRYQLNHRQNKKILNFEEFTLLLKNTFRFLHIGRVRKQIFRMIFDKIDTNNDGMITFDEYLRWVKLYLGVETNRGDEHYFAEDDDSIRGRNIVQEEKTNKFKLQKKTSSSSTSSSSSHKLKFLFSDYGLSERVRIRVSQLLLPFDQNQDHHFDKQEITNALVTLLKEDENELPYFLGNVFRYDKNHDNIITLDELTNFCVEQHFGEMAIQRLHRKNNNYSRGSERIMNKKEFEMTLNHALDYIHMQATKDEIDLLFSEIDLQKTGWISYEVYFTFLKHYFGSMICHPCSQPDEKDQEWLNSLKNMSGLDRFIKMLMEQLKQIFFMHDTNKNMLFEEDEIEQILREIFGLSHQQTDYVLKKLFNFANKEEKSLTFDKLVAILLEIYFIDIVLKNNLTEGEKKNNNNKINMNQFIKLVSSACFFLKKKPYTEDLMEIFKMLDTDSDGCISFDEYSDFIKKYLGLGIRNAKPLILKRVESIKPQNVSDEEWDFINAIWSELREYFDKYDTEKKGYLANEDLKRFVMEVLRENSKAELNYIFWNLFRFDHNHDAHIVFNQFAPFILNHSGEIALQKFHREQIKGKSTLSEEELHIVFSNAFSFLSTMPKSDNAIKFIYKRIGKGKEPTYGAYLTWIHCALASKFE